MFTFEHKEYLLLLFALPIILGLHILYNYRRKSDIRKMGNPEIISSLIPDYSEFRFTIKIILILIGLGFIIIAIAGPRFGSKLTEVKHEGIDLIIALDVSNSMLAEDIKPNRLERAKQELSRLLNKLVNDRIGLIVFAGEAYTQIPITNDYLSAKMFLAGINTDMVTRQGTAIGEAIDLAIRSYNYQSKSEKALLIISDGENHEGGVSDACRKAVDKGIRIYTIGMGLNQGVRIPERSSPYNRDYKRDKDGNFVITHLDEQMLKDIASKGNGKYYKASSSDIGLNKMLLELNKLNKTGSTYAEYSEYNEQFPGFILMALIVLVIEFFILGKKNKFLKKIKLLENSK